MSEASCIHKRLGGKIKVAANIKVVHQTFGKVFIEGTAFQRGGSQFDALFEDDGTIIKVPVSAVCRTGTLAMTRWALGEADARPVSGRSGGLMMPIRRLCATWNMRPSGLWATR
ncbi:hypothetical protein [Tateyamaria pelophila]|uniref:hypothetical protein n=1 Tax=Tateyamaria pelophila TaxID=328415 RepID=UPI001CBBCC61|nr:hypothetical protein [Tateyamaria pelophila]